VRRIHSHYENLKVARDAPPEVLRAAYRVLAQKYHPDRHDGDERAERTMKLINEAYSVLSDPTSRQAHDQWIELTESGPSEPQESTTTSSPPHAATKRNQPHDSPSETSKEETSETTRPWQPEVVTDPNALNLDDAWARFKSAFGFSPRR
jgi:DnaJ-class molecular chaperone